MSNEMQKKELEQVSGGASGTLLSPHLQLSGPYQCPFCGEDYYLGNEEIHVGMCQKCWHDPDRMKHVLERHEKKQ